MQRLEALLAIIAFVVAILVAFGIYHLIYSAPRMPTRTVQCPPPPEMKEVMIASKIIHTGDSIAEAIVYEKWPESSVKSGFYVKNQVPDEQLKTLIAMRVINPGEPITTNSVVDRKNRGVLSALLKEGMRAVSINLEQNSGIASLLNPGDIVDVLVTLNATGKEKEEETNRTVLCAVRVLALDQHLSNTTDLTGKKASDNGQAPKSVTLEVTPQQASELAAAIKMGTISLSLHSTNDGTPTCAQATFKATEPVKIIRGDGTVATSPQDR